MTAFGLGSARKSPAIVILVPALLILVACGGYSAGVVKSPSSVPGTVASAVVNITDSPSDRIVIFEVALNSVTFFRADGSAYSVLNTPHRIEVTHLAGSAAPVVVPLLPQGTYTRVAIDLSAPKVVYIDNAGKTIEKDQPSATFSLNIPLTPGITVGSMASVLTVDIDVNRSVLIDPSSGNVTVNPVATIGQAPVAARDGIAPQDPEYGEFEHIIGQVTAATANSFRIAMSGSGTALAFTTDANTKFGGAGSAATLPLNSIVHVEAAAKQDGSVVADEVEVVSMSGTELEGVVVSQTGAATSSFDLVVQDGNGDGVSSTSIGTRQTFSVNGGTKFSVYAGNINLDGLNLPEFSASTLFKGQRVETESAGAQNGMSLVADEVILQQQALTGVISGSSTSGFTLTLSDDSAFKLLTGRNIVTVLRQQNTELKDGVTIANANVVRVRGLVFFDPSSGNYSMVAGRISTP